MNVFVADEQSQEVDIPSLRELVHRVLETEGCPPDSEVSLLLVGDDEMAAYNVRFLERPGPTDVISLPIEELVPGRPPGSVPGGPPVMLGDVILAPAYIHRQAEELGEDFGDEIALLTVHGLLHLLGYDHDTEEKAEEMEARERHILASVGRRRR